ncbi:MAG TPA: hypothetical protein PKM20_08965, partial [Nitrosomonas sp.]|nr:hypothetical protein [Nitrosomonas sp.]
VYMNNESTENNKDSTKGKISFPPLTKKEPPESARDPLRILMEIAADPDIDGDTKAWLFNFSVSRFNNRRRMAYLSLIAIIVFMIFLIFGAVHDGVSECVVEGTCKGIMTSISEIKELLIWIGGFLTTIVAAYYGVTSFRPSS